MQPRTLRLPPRLTALVFIAAVAALAIPASATAAITPAVTGNQLTISSDAASDNITLTVNTAGELTHNFTGGGLVDSTDFDVAAGTQKLLSNGTIVVTVNAGPGNDNVDLSAPNLAPSIINGDDGDDIIVGTAAVDTINGGPGNDALNGGSGGDRIVGDRGADTFNGGAGDDTTVWNNGDGSDIMNGDEGVDRVEVNLSAAADTSTLKLENGRVRYDRTNPGPFNLSIATAEVFELNTLGGDDTLATSAGVRLAVVADGGAGNDTLQGAEGNDTLDGGDGNDTLNLRDGASDFARGGPGTDHAVADAVTVDAVAADVETVDWTASPSPAPAPAPTTPAAGAASVLAAAKVTRNAAAVVLSCPAGTSGCTGAVTLLSTKTLKAGPLRAQLVFGHQRFALNAGERRIVRVKLAPGTARLAKKWKLGVTARVVSEGAAERVSKVTLAFK